MRIPPRGIVALSDPSSIVRRSGCQFGARKRFRLAMTLAAKLNHKVKIKTAEPPRGLRSHRSAGSSTRTRPAFGGTVESGAIARELGGTAPDRLAPLPGDDSFPREGGE
jgi:hypothetical protein